MTLLSSPGGDGPRYVYVVYERGELRRWMHGATIAADREGCARCTLSPIRPRGSELAALARG